MTGVIEGGILQLIVALGGAIFTAFKSFQFIQEGERGVKLRFGKVVRRQGQPRVIEPGFVLMIPWVETLRRRHVRQQTVTLAAQTITLESGLIFQVAGVVYFRVKDVYKALFEIENLDEAIEQLAMGILRDEIAKKSDHKDLADTGKIAKKIYELILEKTKEWGVDVIDFRLTTVAPSAKSAEVVNLEAAAKMRAKMVETCAGQLKTEMDDIISSGLAAVLVGNPLVASTNISVPPTSRVKEK